MPLSEPLAGHPLFRSADAEEARAFLRDKHFDIAFHAPPSRPLDVRVHGLYGPRSYFGYVRYGAAPATFRPREFHTEFWLQLPLSGRLRATIGDETITADRNTAVIASPFDQSCAFEVAPAGARLQLAISRTALLERLARLLDDEPVRPLRFAAVMDLTAGPGRRIADRILTTLRDLDADFAADPAAILTEIEDVLLSALLLTHPNTYSDALARRNRSVATRDVKRAIDFIQAHAADPGLDFAGVRSAVGVPGRTLFQHFRDHLGLTPMAYVRHVRFRRARRALLSDRSGQSVAEIARACGFRHMGRFAVEYSARYGERPSVTLRKGRASPTTSFLRPGVQPQGRGITVMS